MPRDGRATRERILRTAERLVIDDGFAATSVDAVIAGSGTSKGAFFHHFASKSDLARALVERYAAADLDHLDRALRLATSADDDPAARVEAFLRYFEDSADELMAEQSSCLYVAILAERQLVLDGTAEPVRRAIEGWRAGLAALLEAAVPREGGHIDVEALADHVFVTFEGAFVLARSTSDPGHMRRQLRVLRQLVVAALGDGSPRAGTPGDRPQVLADSEAPRITTTSTT